MTQTAKALAWNETSSEKILIARIGEKLFNEICEVLPMFTNWRVPREELAYVILRRGFAYRLERDPEFETTAREFVINALAAWLTGQNHPRDTQAYYDDLKACAGAPLQFPSEKWARETERYWAAATKAAILRGWRIQV